MTFAGLGDTLLYAILPVYATDMGFSAMMVGLLLSVNRFVRILANTPMANLVNQIGMKKVLILTSVLAVLTTMAYGFRPGLIGLLVARVLWGLSYSGLKIATLNYAAKVQNRTALAFGLAQSIKSLGPLLVLWIGPVLIGAFGFEKGLMVIALFSILGVLLALSLPANHPPERKAKVRSRITFYPDPTNLLVFILSIAIDGILVVTLSSLWLEQGAEITRLLALVSFYLLMKKLFMSADSLLSGLLTIRIAPVRMYVISVLICLFGLGLISAGYIAFGIILAFLFNTLVATYSPLVALTQFRHNSLQAISGVSTWWDLGAAIGAFSGIFLIQSLGSKHLFLSLFLLSLAAFINFIIRYANTSRSTV